MSMSGWRIVARRWRTALPASPACFRNSSTSAATVIDVLESRGLVAQISSRKLRQHVATAPRTIYLGVDPTAPSLHVGNLLALVGLLHFVIQGHNAIALIGGGTGSIGDPSGRSTERQALGSEVLRHNVEGIRSQVAKIVQDGLAYARERSGKARVYQNPGNVKVLDNVEWLGSMGLLEFLSTVGRQARVSAMLARDSVKNRLTSTAGISFTEFSYQLLQAYDFATLREKHGCSIQLGGSDQWGNIMSGIELMLRLSASQPTAEDAISADGAEGVYGLTLPLLTTASGQKFGKSAGNAIWLDPKLTPPVDLYQAFLRTGDADVEKYLKMLTFVPLTEIEGIMARHQASPEAREPQHVLATELTHLVHGAAGANQAHLATAILFTKPLMTSLPASTVLAAFQNSPHLVQLPRMTVADSPFLDLLVLSKLCRSRGEAREALKSGSIAVNHERSRGDGKDSVAPEMLVEGGVMLLTKGKSAYKVVELV